jgi:hypothetical protein
MSRYYNYLKGYKNINGKIYAAKYLEMKREEGQMKICTSIIRAHCHDIDMIGVMGMK